MIDTGEGELLMLNEAVLTGLALIIFLFLAAISGLSAAGEIIAVQFSIPLSLPFLSGFFKSAPLVVLGILYGSFLCLVS